MAETRGKEASTACSRVFGKNYGAHNSQFTILHRRRRPFVIQNSHLPPTPVPSRGRGFFAPKRRISLTSYPILSPTQPSHGRASTLFQALSLSRERVSTAPPRRSVTKVCSAHQRAGIIVEPLPHPLPREGRKYHVSRYSPLGREADLP